MGEFEVAAGVFAFKEIFYQSHSVKSVSCSALFFDCFFNLHQRFSGSLFEEATIK